MIRNIGKLSIALLFVLFLMPTGAFADTTGFFSLTPSGDFTFLDFQNANSDRGAPVAPATKSIDMFKGTYPDDSTGAGSVTWNVFPINQWRANYNCIINSTTSVLCRNSSSLFIYSSAVANGSGDYWFRINDSVYTGGISQIYSFHYDGNLFSGGSSPPVDHSTHIETVTPSDNETIATSTAATFGATGYVNEADFKSGMYVQMQYASFGSYQSSIANVQSLFTVIDFPITSAGDFSFSTTSSLLTVGQYTMQTQIRTSSFLNTALNFLGFGQFANFGINNSTSTKFVAAHLSGYDVYVASTTAMIDSYIASSTISLSSCTSFTGFSLGDCMAVLLLPQQEATNRVLSNFKNGFLSYFPWGYVTRFVTILSGSATTTLPVISIETPLGRPGSPEYTDGTFTLDTNDMLTGGDTLLNSVHTSYGGDFSVQEVLEPFVRLTIALALTIAVIQDLIGMANHRRRDPHALH